MAICGTAASCAEATPLCDAREGVCRRCYPGEDAACRARDATLPRCSAGRCVACLTPTKGPAEVSECAGPPNLLSATPVCEQDNCRPCQRHSECASGVCSKDDASMGYGVPKGSCVPASQVLVVDQSLCNKSGPVFCTPQQALDRIDRMHRYVVLRKSAFAADFASLALGAQPAHAGLTLYLIGPTADDPPVAGTRLPPVSLGEDPNRTVISVQRSRVVVEGLYIHDGKIGVSCTGSDASLYIARSLISGNSTAVLATSGCPVTVEQSWLGRGPQDGPFAVATANARGIEVMGSDFTVVNSVLCDNGDYRQDGFGGIRVRSLPAGNNISTVINTTFYQQSGLLKTGMYYTTMLCDAPLRDRIALVNSLFFTDKPLLTGPEEHYLDPSCGARTFNLASNDPLISEDQSVVLSMSAQIFKSAPTRDLRLLTDGEAAKVRSAGAASVSFGNMRLSAPPLDIEGQSRPTSGGLAIGAYEPGR